MAAIGWTEIRGQKFSESEAREASDFNEILSNFALDPQMVYTLFHQENLSVAKRLVLAETIPLDEASAMLFTDSDSRIREVIQVRLREDRLNATGNIIC